MTEHMDPGQKQELAFFDSLMPSGQAGAGKETKEGETPSKYPRSNDKGGSGGRGKGNDRKPTPTSKASSQGDSQTQEWQSWNWHKEGGDARTGRIAALEQQGRLSRMALRHEDGLNMLRSEVSYVVHAKIGCESSIVGALYRVQAAWRETKKDNPEKLERPMRATLILCLFKEILCRVERLGNDEQALSEFKAHGWISEDLNFWPVLTWDADSKKLVPVKSLPSLTTAVLVDHLKAVIRRCTGNHARARFHPVRPISDSTTGVRRIVRSSLPCA